MTAPKRLEIKSQVSRHDGRAGTALTVLTGRLRQTARLWGEHTQSCQLVSRGLVAPNYDTSAAEETQKRGDGEQAGGASAVEKVERDPDVTPCRDPSSQGETLQNAAELDTKAIRGPGQPTETSFTAPVAEASECSEGDEGD